MLGRRKQVYESGKGHYLNSLSPTPASLHETDVLVAPAGPASSAPVGRINTMQVMGKGQYWGMLVTKDNKTTRVDKCKSTKKKKKKKKYSKNRIQTIY